MKTLSTVFWVLAVLLSDVMCAIVAYNYCDMVWGISMRVIVLLHGPCLWLLFLLLLPLRCALCLHCFLKRK